MTGAMRFAILFPALLLGLAVGASAWLLLQSCGVRLPLTGRVLSYCEPERAHDLRLALEDQELLTQRLRVRISGQEQALAGMQCTAVPPPPPEPAPKPAPTEPPTPSGLAPDAFNGKDISVMKGCWLLSSNYAVREITTGEITRFKYWRICFDKNGRGKQEMRSTNGVRCKGRIAGRMPGNGRLTMREPGNLKCDNNSSIFRRDITCSLDARGNARCETYQPETNGRSTATLRRAGR